MFWGHALILLLTFCLDKATPLGANTSFVDMPCGSGSEGDYVDFGYHVMISTQKKVDGYTHIRVIFVAPPNSTTYWEVNGIPVLELDRYTSVTTETMDNLVVTTLRSSGHVAMAVLCSYSFRPYTVSMKHFFVKPEQLIVHFYSPDVSYTKPEHTGTSVNVNYEYNRTYPDESRIYAVAYFVQDNPPIVNKTFLLGNKQGDLFENQVSDTGNHTTCTLVPRDLSLINSSSTLVTYGIFLKYTSPLAYMRFEIEDDFDFAGLERPLANADIVITGFYTTPSPLDGTRQGSIVCEAIGNPAPSLEILKLWDNGEYVSVNYPGHMYRTNFRTVKTLVINYPLDQDSGNYTCFARSPGKETSQWQVATFEPPPQFEEDVHG